MKRINDPDEPKGSSLYELDDGRLFRVHLIVLTPVELIATGDRIEFVTRGYQIDSLGRFVTGADGEPIMIKEQRAIIPMENVRNGTFQLKPGWVKQVTEGAPGDDAPENKVDPQEGDYYHDGESLYRWTDGVYEIHRRSRLLDAPPAPRDALSDTEVMDLLP